MKGSEKTVPSPQTALCCAGCSRLNIPCTSAVYVGKEKTWAIVVFSRASSVEEAIQVRSDTPLRDPHLRPPQLKVSTQAHTKHLGWCAEFEFRVTHSCYCHLRSGADVVRSFRVDDDDDD